VSVLLQEPVGELDELALLEAQRDRLLSQLRVQRERALEFYAWYDGEQEPPSQPVDPALGHAQEMQALREKSRGAWARLVIDTIVERLAVQGVRSTLGEQTDRQAWQLLQDNRIDADQHGIYTQALIAGHSYASVRGGGAGEPVRIMPESLLEVTHSHAPGDRRTVTAALKLFMLEDADLWVAELYTPTLLAVWTAAYKDRRRTPLREGAQVPWSEPAIATNTLGAVPFVPFGNRPTTMAPGHSELRELVPVMERIDEIKFAEMIAVHTDIFMQKWMTGDEVPKDPETGKPISPFTSSHVRVWISENPDARFGAFPATDVDQYLKAHSAEVAELASIAKVPFYQLPLTALANPPSAESLIAGEAGLVNKCLDRMRGFGESWEELVRLAATAAELEELAQDRALEMIWGSPERRNPAILADAAVKYASVGMPFATNMEEAGFSPQKIDRMQIARASEALLASAAEPPPA
jgi:SPP1 Gp6-like portal protein